MSETTESEVSNENEQESAVPREEGRPEETAEETSVDFAGLSEKDFSDDDDDDASQQVAAETEEGKKATPEDPAPLDAATAEASALASSSSSSSSLPASSPDAESAKSAKEGDKPAEQATPPAPEMPGVDTSGVKVDSSKEELQKVADRLTEFYALSEEEAETFNTDPASMLPKMAAKLHMQILRSVSFAVESTLPGAISFVQQRSSTEEAVKKAFMERWPLLAKPEYEKDIVQTALLYRQQNPQATQEAAIDAVGSLIMLQKGLLKQALSEQQEKVSSQEKVVSLRPDVPARPAAAQVPANKAGGGNIFAQMSEEVYEDD